MTAEKKSGKWPGLAKPLLIPPREELGPSNAENVETPYSPEEHYVDDSSVFTPTFLDLGEELRDVG